MLNALLSIDRFSDWSNASVHLAEYEKSSCHLEASVQWFEAKTNEGFVEFNSSAANQ